LTIVPLEHLAIFARAAVSRTKEISRCYVSLSV
jgi:hypothetical protein